MTSDKSFAYDGCKCATPTVHQGINKDLLSAVLTAAANILGVINTEVINSEWDVVMAAAVSIILL